MLERLLLVISQSKGPALSTRASARQVVVSKLRKWNFEGALSGMSLGRDQAMKARGARGSKVLQARLRRLQGRRSSIRGLKSSRKGMMRVARSRGLASATFGARVHGIAQGR
eukprot:4364963-Pyramimonas_sp.AAC.1